MIPDSSQIQSDGYLVVDRVTKEYRGRSGNVVALRDISLEVGRGEFFALVGPSGCGKTTLLRIIAGLAPVSSGSVSISGASVGGPVRVGMVFQSPALVPWRSAIDNVLLAVDLAGLSVRAHRSRAEGLLELVGLSGFGNARPSELSGGMQQRVALCRALVIEPDLLLMDEPFAALDAFTRDDLNSELLRIWSSTEPRKTIIFVTHSIPEALFLADRVCVMSPLPGRVEVIVDAGLPRPRLLDVRSSPAFGRQVLSIYKCLEAGRGVEVAGSVSEG